MSAVLNLPARMSLMEFLAWGPGDGLPYQLIDGEPRAMAPAGNVHNLLQGELLRLSGNHLRAHRPGCEILPTPGVVPRLLSAHNLRVPDLGVTCTPLAPGPALPDPVLLIEILSPSNQADTWANVWAYTSIPSVQEILVVESQRVGVYLLRRHAETGWQELGEPAREGDLVLESIGFRVPLATLYARTDLR